MATVVGREAQRDGADFLLDRRIAVPRLIGRHEDFLLVSGLAGTSKDLAALTNDAPHLFTMAGAMGGASMIGLGLALAQPARRVLVVTGDGELLMSVGSLATIAMAKPPNLAIVCVDNGRYGETGYQETHTARVTDLEGMAHAAGIPTTLTIRTQDQVAVGHDLLRRSPGPVFILLRVAPTEPPAVKRNMDPAAVRLRFREHLLRASAHLGS